MTKLKGLLLTEGMHGMISQVEGLAKSLNLDFIHEKIEINNFYFLQFHFPLSSELHLLF